MNQSSTDSTGRRFPGGVTEHRTACARSFLLLTFLIAIATTSVFAISSDRRLATSALLSQLRVADGPNVPVFDLSDASIPVGEIRHGGPPKDGIPALSMPAFLSIEEASYLSSEDRVIGVEISDEARAYPLRILNYHEIVNDVVGETPIAVTYCPLCDSAAVFDRRTPLGEQEFGVSGLLYNSNVLLYDRSEDTESLWSQLGTSGVTGPGTEMALTVLPLELTTWEDWSSRHPDTLVLSEETGHRRDYRSSPYRLYFRTQMLLFPVSERDDRLEIKTPVFGVWTDDGARAYPLSAFEGETHAIEDDINGASFTIEYRAASNSLRMLDADEGVRWTYAFWFAWYVFHPATTVYSTSR